MRSNDHGCGSTSSDVWSAQTQSTQSWRHAEDVISILLCMCYGNIKLEQMDTQVFAVKMYLFM